MRLLPEQALRLAMTGSPTKHEMPGSSGAARGTEESDAGFRVCDAGGAGSADGAGSERTESRSKEMLRHQPQEACDNEACDNILSGAADVALVVGADTTPKGFLKPNEGDRPDDMDWLRFKLVGATNPVYFGLNARRRMDLYGASSEDFARVKVKNSRHSVHNPRARFTKEYGIDDVLASPIVSDPLRLLDICTTSDGGAALVLASMDFAKAHGHADPVRAAGMSTVLPTYPDTVIDLPYLATDSAAATPEPERGFKQSIGDKVYAEAGMGPDDIDVAEVYDLSSALELDWYEQLGFCAEGEAEKLLRDGVTSIGGTLPVNPSGGLGAFGEAVPAQALAQVCELVWQLRGSAGERQVHGARVGITANQGLFGHGSSVLVRR